MYFEVDPPAPFTHLRFELYIEIKITYSLQLDIKKCVFINQRDRCNSSHGALNAYIPRIVICTDYVLQKYIPHGVAVQREGAFSRMI